VACAVVDARRHPRDGVQYAGLVVSAVAAALLAWAGTRDVADVIRVWGTWAVVAGLVALVVALRRRRVGGQWPQVVSGGLSVVVGAGLWASAAHAGSARELAGYAVAGAVFFLVSALRVRR
jgi:uncharacterized membrane protein HdeD (DUF308 family)